MLEKQLEKYFDFKEFRPGQKEVIESIMAGKDVLALMPTGGGKSLCYQLPSILTPNLSIVVSPLIALMKDQVDSLRARGIAAAFINSSLDQREIERIISELKKGNIKILYIAPERFEAGGFKNLASELEVDLLSIDEAHCVSQWGHDFRPDYLKIRNYIKLFKKRPVVAAFTATATPEVKDDIIERIELQNPAVFIRGFDRPNLRFFVQTDLKPKEKLRELERIAKSIEGSGIVYTLTRKDAEQAAEYLRNCGIKSAHYHAGMDPADRKNIQERFMENRFKLIVATIAFGMGVDKSDVRFVVHFGMPSSIEGYYQEAGRAGRDGETAYCVLLHGKKDVSTHEYFLRNSREEMERLGKPRDEIRAILNIKYHRLDRMIEYATRNSCRRKMILRYFNDPEHSKAAGNCRGCDVCLNWKRTGRGAGFAKEDVIKENIRTVLKTAELYRQNHDPVQIAKIRGLGVRTVWDHLIRWFASGGELRIEEFLSPAEESMIRKAIGKVGLEKLSPIKALLPEEITYEKIKLAVAKMKKESSSNS